MMDEMAKELPSVKEVLIDERDRYLATSIFLSPGEKKLAVIGAGHQTGIIKTIKAIEEGSIGTDLSDISTAPKGGKSGKIISWGFPILIVGFLLYGFFNLGQSEGIKMFGYWLAVNMSFTAIGAILALAHPLNILVSILAAPLTSLHPGIGVGMVSGLMELRSENQRSGTLNNWEMMQPPSRGGIATEYYTPFLCSSTQA